MYAPGPTPPTPPLGQLWSSSATFTGEVIPPTVQVALDVLRSCHERGAARFIQNVVIERANAVLHDYFDEYLSDEDEACPSTPSAS